MVVKILQIVKRGQDRAIGKPSIQGERKKGVSMKETKKDQVENQTTEECGVEDANRRVS